MKKVVLFVMFMSLIASCGVDGVLHESHTDGYGVREQIIGSGIRKLTIEGHEYFKFIENQPNGVGVSVVHSASCPIDGVVVTE